MLNCQKNEYNFEHYLKIEVHVKIIVLFPFLIYDVKFIGKFCEFKNMRNTLTGINI